MISPNWVYFFYYDESSLDDMNELNLTQGLMQPRRTLYYFRQEGAGVQESENLPNSLGLFISLRYNIVKWIAYMNDYVTDGDEGFPDRRLAVSQEFITISQKGQEVDVDVFYIPFNNYKNPLNITVQIG